MNPHWIKIKLSLYVRLEYSLLYKVLNVSFKYLSPLESQAESFSLNP